MNHEAGELAKKLARIQSRLRNELMEELKSHEGDLEAIFDPYSFSPIVHELREKYLTRLHLLHEILGYLVVNICFEEGAPDLTEALLDVLLVEHTPAPELLEDLVEFFGEFFEHG